MCTNFPYFYIQTFAKEYQILFCEFDSSFCKLCVQIFTTLNSDTREMYIFVAFVYILVFLSICSVIHCKEHKLSMHLEATGKAEHHGNEQTVVSPAEQQEL